MTTDERFHDAYIDAWNRALESGESAPIEHHLSPSYHGWTASSVDDPAPFSTQDARDGFSAAVFHRRGHRAQAIGRSIARRGDAEAVVFYELRLTDRDVITARALLIETWRRDAEGWRLYRDTTEHGAGFGATSDAGAPASAADGP